MENSLCKKHFREVANHFDKETALAYSIDEHNCVICNRVIFIEAARRFAQSNPQNSNDQPLRLLNTFAQLRA